MVKWKTKRLLAIVISVMMIPTAIPFMTAPVTAAGFEQTQRVNQLSGNTNIRDIQMGRNEGGSAAGAPASGNYAIWWDLNSASIGASRRMIMFTVTNVPQAGKYALNFYWYTRGDGPETTNNRKMSINGAGEISVDFRPTGANKWEYFTVIADLQVGQNTIKLRHDGAGNTWLLLDHLKVTEYDGILDRDKFLTDYADVLAFDINYVTAKDKPRVDAALAAYAGLPAIAQGILTDEKTFIDQLKTKIDGLAAERDRVLAAFGFKDVLALTVFNVSPEHENRIMMAIFAYEALPENDKEALADQKVLFYSLLEKTEKIKNAGAAQAVMDDWLSVYLKIKPNDEISTYGWSNRSDVSGSDGDETGMWHGANVYELLNDAYEYSKDPEYKAMIKTYMDGYYKRVTNGSFSWSGTFNNNGYTDDILWWSNAFTRTYMLTGDTKFLTEGERVFNRAYDRAWDIRAVGALGSNTRFSGVQGGLLWNYTTSGTWNPGVSTNYPSTNEKNVATNGNGAINAARLSRVYKELGNTEKSELYAAKALNIYNWMKASMPDPAVPGRLIDNFQQNGNARDWQFSYNYGLFAGAAYEMWLNTGDGAYIEDLKLILGYGWRTLTEEDGLTFNTEADMNGGDGAAFRLVLARYTATSVQNAECAEFNIYLLANAYQTWVNRRPDDGLVGSSSAFAAESGVRIPSTVAAFGPELQWYSGFDPALKYGFEENLVKWKVGYKSLKEAADDQFVNMNPIFIRGGAGFNSTTETPKELFDYTAGNPAGTGTKYGGNPPYWAQWRYDEAFIASRFIIATANDNFSWPRRMGDGWTLSGSNDGENWEVLYTGMAKDYSNFNNMFYAFDLSKNTTAYTHYMLYSDVSGDTSGTVQLSVAALAYYCDVCKSSGEYCGSCSADYTAVNAAIESAKALNKDLYTEESWNKLQASIESVKFYDLRFQNTVDGFAAAVYEAIGDLAVFLDGITNDVFSKGLENNLVKDGKTIKLVFGNREYILSENANNVNISGEIELGDGYYLIFDIKGNGKNIKAFEVIRR